MIGLDGHPRARGGRRSRRAARRCLRAGRRARAGRRRRRRPEGGLEGRGAGRATSTRSSRRPAPIELAGDEGDPRQVEVILRESAEVVRSRPPLVIARDAARLRVRVGGSRRLEREGAGTVILLPSIRTRRRRDCASGSASLRASAPGVIVSDSFGRAWRQGTTDVALGVAGHRRPARPPRLARRQSGYELQSTMIAVADEIAGAAELVMGKAHGSSRRDRPRRRRGRARAARADLVMPRERDLFS